MQPEIDAEAWQAKRSLLLEVRKPSRRQDLTVWETLASTPRSVPVGGVPPIDGSGEPRGERPKRNGGWVSDAPIEAESGRYSERVDSI